MALPTPAARWVAGALFLLIAIAGTSAAQLPELPNLDDPDRAVLGFAVVAHQTYVEVDFIGSASVEMLVMDLSRDSTRIREAPGGGAPMTTPVHRSVSLSVVEIFPAEAQGWQVLLGQPFVALQPGETVSVPMLIQTAPSLDTYQIKITLLAEYVHSSGYTDNQTFEVHAKVKPYFRADIQVRDVVQRAGQFERVTFPVDVTNFGVYPDMYRFTVSVDKAGYLVTSVPNIYVPPGETRTTYVHVLTPHGKAYEVGETALVSIRADSVTGTGTYSKPGVVQVRGPYLPVYWIPLLLVGLVSAGIVTDKASEYSRRKGEEKGRPRRVQPTPRQAVLLAELKRTDPEAYKQRKARLDALYASRRAIYREGHKERVTADRAEAREARQELREERRRRKAERQAAAAQAKLEKKAAAKQRKLDKKTAKAAAKEQKKLDKQTAKKRTALEKQRDKLAAKKAKVEKAEAKARAREEKRAAKQAAAEAKAAKRREKSR